MADPSERSINENINRVAGNNNKSEARCLREVRFEETLQSSRFIRPIRMNFQRNDTSIKQFYWDLALEHDNVAVLLYHREKKSFLLVKQFRPPVYVQRIRQMPENVGRSLTEIDWPSYPISLGETVELCSGLMDKMGKDALETVREEIAEECGYNVDVAKIEKIKHYLTGVGISGSSQHLFFAEIDETMKAGEGGGIAAEGEFIEKVFWTFNEARQVLDDAVSTSSPPSLMFALSWFFRNKSKLVQEADSSTVYHK